jgi:hypothetical protein
VTTVGGVVDQQLPHIPEEQRIRISAAILELVNRARSDHGQ